MAAPPEIIELVEKFSRGIERYKSNDYNEQEMRTTFILPMFAALGWDTYQEQDTLEVKEEESIAVDGIELNPDYRSFLSPLNRAYSVIIAKSIRASCNI